MPFGKAAKQREELEFRILSFLYRRPDSSQRDIAAHTRASLGTVNACVKELVSEGLIKPRESRQSAKVMGYAYVLTHKGLEERAVLATRLLGALRAEYEMMLQELDDLLAEFPHATAQKPDVKR